MKKFLLSLLFISNIIFATEPAKSPEEIQLYREQLHYGKNNIVIGDVKIKGYGSVELKPEFISLSFLLNTQSKSMGFGNDKNAQEKASEENAKIINDFIEYLLSIGVKNENISTTKYNASSGRVTFVSSGEINHSIKVTFNIGTDIGSVLKKIESTPIKQVGEMYYSVSENTKRDAYLKAQKIALEDANKQASNMSEIGKCTLGDIKYINTFPIKTMRGENDNYDPNHYKMLSKTEAPPISTNGIITVYSEVECAYDLLKGTKE